MNPAKAHYSNKPRNARGANNAQKPASPHQPAPDRFPPNIIRDARKHDTDYSALEVTPESRYSCLLPYQFEQTTEVYQRELRTAPSRVIDATANIGCDTIHFRRMYPGAHITSIEIEQNTAKLLANNMTKISRILGREATAPETRNCDCVEYLATGARADLVYFDPPWGGPEYYKAQSMKLTLGGRPLGKVVGETLAQNTPVVVAKVPVNLDLEDFKSSTGVKATYASYDIRKPSANAKGPIAYRLLFIRLAAPTAEAAIEPAAGPAAEPAAGSAAEPTAEAAAEPAAELTPLMATTATNNATQAHGAPTTFCSS